MRADPGSGSAARRPHAVVIGSGFGGLAAAVRLGARGYAVTVVEALDAPGGRAYVYRQDGFTFDAGPTIVTAPFLFEELWELAGKRLADDVELVPCDPFYRIRFADGSSFDYNGNAQQMRDRIQAFAPGDEQGYERFMAFSERIFKVGFEQLGHVPFHRFGQMLKVAPDLIRLRSYQSVYSLVSSFVRDERLRIILSFHPLLVGGHPFHTTSVYALISALERRWGVHFAMGGTNKLVSGLVGLIETQGNRVRCQAPVRRILIKDGRAAGVELESGERLAADLVVSNADAATTYQKLLGDHPRRRWTDRKLARTRSSMSLFVWYFGTRKQYTDVPHHMILLGPRYRGLLDDIFRRQALAEDFSLYLHRPTATDPSLAPAGCDSFYVLSPVPHLEDGTDWEQMAEPYRQRIEAFLAASVLPGLGDNIVSSRLLTPHDFAHRLRSYRGAAFAMEPNLLQSAWFRPHNRSEELPGLFLVGAGTHPGAGLPGVLSSARVLDQLIPHAQSLHATAG